MSISNPHRFAAAPPSFAFNNALQFDGVNDEVRFIQNPNSDSWAFSTWVNSALISVNTTRLIGDTNSNNYIQLNNSLGAIVRSIDGTQKFFSFPTILDNTWYHLVVSVDNLSCRSYLNGVESVAGPQIVSSNGTAPINQYQAFGQAKSLYSIHKMDEVGLWYGSFLTQSDVDALYNGGLGSDVSLINNGTLWVGTHLDEDDPATTTANLGSSGILTLTNFTAPNFIPH